MSAGRRIGGMIAIVVGFLLIFLLIYALITWELTTTVIIQVIFNFIIAILCVLGGFMALSNNKTGAPLIAAAGIGSIFCSILYAINQTTFIYVMPYSMLSVYLSIYIPYVTLEAILMVFAGIISVVSAD